MAWYQNRENYKISELQVASSPYDFYSLEFVKLEI
jgi:hypothetical protein